MTGRYPQSTPRRQGWPELPMRTIIFAYALSSKDGREARDPSEKAALNDDKQGLSYDRLMSRSCRDMAGKWRANGGIPRIQI